MGAPLRRALKAAGAAPAPGWELVVSVPLVCEEVSEFGSSGAVLAAVPCLYDELVRFQVRTMQYGGTSSL